MKNGALDDWLRLFNEGVEKVWVQEIPEFRTLAMIYHCFNGEIKRLQTCVDEQMTEFKKSYVTNTEDKIRRNEQRTPTKTSSEHKENISPNRTVLSTQSMLLDLQSPDMFAYLRKSPMISKKSPTFSKKSPTISKKSPIIPRKSPNVSPDVSILNQPVNWSDSKDSETTKLSPLSPKINGARRDLLRKKKLSQNSEKSPPSSYIDLDITFKSPKRAIANLIDSTYIETTPVLPPRKRTKNSTHKASESKRSCRTGSSKQSSTLTQMLGGITQLSRSNSTTTNHCGTTDITKCTQSTINNESGDEDSVLSILKRANKFSDDPLGPRKEKSESDRRKIKSLRLNDNQPESTNTFKSKTAESKDNFNLLPSSFIADYDRVPIVETKDVNYVYKEKTVRGKERQKLEGWDCAECKKFYENLGLEPDKIKSRMNKCSRHRQKFAPVPDTPPGFWDLDMVTTQETQEKSLLKL